jgi:hypothetical protein
MQSVEVDGGRSPEGSVNLFGKTTDYSYISVMQIKNYFKISLCLPLFLFCPAGIVPGQSFDYNSFISSENGVGYFALSEPGYSSPLYVDTNDYPGVIRALNDLKTDIGRITGTEPDLISDHPPKWGNIVIAGTLGKSAFIDKLIKNKKLDVSALTGKWETFTIQVIEKPLSGVDRALVIAGSDKRGTIYGIYDLAEQIGISPWYWWADVPVKKKSCIYVKPGVHSQGEPMVKYRGIFINDEAPALSGWAYEKFGGFNHKMYEKVFELILRLKGNFLWPAMWGNAFYDDDTLNAKLADEYGIVIGTSHHEPMMRAHDEWRRYGSGAWNYEDNEAQLKDFWEKGIRRTGTGESIVTLGMRGDGDIPMTEESNIALLERIIKDQRKILTETTGRRPEDIPQVWALYKEVQDYYDKGMRVPDDITLLLCDDNWGNVRKLPPPLEKERGGGYGMYYHFDFVGGPRNYKWLNTNSVPRIWEQMHLAYRYGIDRIWIVNVGDIKPMEFPIAFFLDFAWNPEKWSAESLKEYTCLWAEQQFGGEHAAAIANILTLYTKYNSRRKPELLTPDTYSLLNYREAETIVADYNKLAVEAQRIYDILPFEYRDAYYQLILFPVLACSNLNELYVTVGKNRLYANQGRSATLDMALRAEALYVQDSLLTIHYNTIMSNGKWNHMMDQTHIGYTSWQQPPVNVMPEVKTIYLPVAADMRVAVEGSETWWPMDTTQAMLPEFTVYEQNTHYFEIINHGQITFDYTVETPVSWMVVTPVSGKIEKEQRVWVSINWKKVPTGNHRIPITITCTDKKSITVFASIKNPEAPKPEKVSGFVESAGLVSIEAEHFSRAINAIPIVWQCIPGLGRTLSGMSPFPVTAQSQTPGEKDSPRLEYTIYFTDTGKARIQVYFSPTLNFTNGNGLRYGISIDDETPQIINIHENETVPDWKYPLYWNQEVSDNIKILVSDHSIEKPGNHILKFWMVDPGLVLQKIVVDMGGVKPSYLGPPESQSFNDKVLGK